MLRFLRNGGWFPLFLVSLLLVSVGANIYLMIRATNDPSFAIEPDYYAKAVAWDDLQAERAASEALGWSLSVEPVATGIRARLTDALSRPIDGAQLALEAFPNAKASERTAAILLPRGGGTYELPRVLGRGTGTLWELRFVATLDSKKFLHVTRLEL